MLALLLSSLPPVEIILSKCLVNEFCVASYFVGAYCAELFCSHSRIFSPRM